MLPSGTFATVLLQNPDQHTAFAPAQEFGIGLLEQFPPESPAKVLVEAVEGINLPLEITTP